MIKFNLSASSLNLYRESQLIFYYNYIVKESPDTITNKVYGDAGNVVHELLETYIENPNLIYDDEMCFTEKWNSKNLDSEKGFTNKPINTTPYLNAFKLGVMKLKNIYNKGKLNPESEIILPFRDNINLKGYIDLVVKTQDEVILVDWKTSSSIDDGDSFKTQGLMYFTLYYLKHSILPKKIVFEYLKIGQQVSYEFSFEEVKEFIKYLNKVVDEIIEKGFDITKYDIGNIDSPFNSHYKKCIYEKCRREKQIKNIINVTIKNNKLKFDENLPNKLKELFTKKYQYQVEGCQFSPKYKSGLWDGKKRLFNTRGLPIGFINNLKKLIEDYNEFFKTNYEINFIDDRDKNVTQKVFNTEFKKSERELRDYQVDAINKVLKNKIGIMYLGTGLGKTFTTFEMIKRINKRTLFVVNRIELVEQVHEDMIKTFGIECGKMSEGNLDIDKQITVASVQTIYSILKRNDETSKELNKYLYNLNVLIWDEAQNVSDSSFYDILMKRVINAEYIIGLTGSPFRNGTDTLEMNAVVGFPVVEYSTKWGEENGWLCPTKCFFIKQEQENLDMAYHEKYAMCVVYNTKRNRAISETVKLFKNKKIMILTKIIKHGEILQEMIPESFLINSKVDVKKRKEDMKKFKSQEGGVMIAGVKIAGAGLNIEDLDVLIIACAHKSAIDSIQTIGRVKRKIPGKEFGYLIDFLDEGYFKKASNERIKVLVDYGNEIKIINQVIEIKEN